MLSWTKGPDGWYSNGFRIELAEPFRWLLVEVDHQKAQVRIEQQPLAVARSLTECKREAELLAAARQRAELRRKHSVTWPCGRCSYCWGPCCRPALVNSTRSSTNSRSLRLPTRIVTLPWFRHCDVIVVFLNSVC